MLDPHRVRVFRSVVASGSVQAAADNLGLTSSAVSQHLAALQRETGLTLFQRVGRGIAPTEAALVLDAQTDEVMSQWGRVDQVVADLRDGRSGRLSIGYFASAGAAWMPSLVKRLTEEFPDLVLELVLNEVEQRRYRGPTSTSSSTRRTRPAERLPADRAHRGPVRRDRAARAPLAEEGDVALADLRGETWVSNDYPRSLGHRLVVAACSAAGFRPRFSVQAQDHYTAIGFVGGRHRGLGAAGTGGAQPAGDRRAARPRAPDAGAPPRGRRARPRRAEPGGRPGGGAAHRPHPQPSPPPRRAHRPLTGRLARSGAAGRVTPRVRGR